MTDSPDRTRLVLRIFLDETDFPAMDAGALAAAGDIACAILHGAGSGDPDVPGRRVRALQDEGVAVLIADDIDMAERTNADGVHLTSAPDILQVYGEARSRLAERIVGVEAGPGRHTAMELGERGADYVAFHLPGQIEDLLWWCGVIEVPSVALGEIDVNTAAELSRHGVEFITAGCEVAAIRELEDAIAPQELASA